MTTDTFATLRLTAIVSSLTNPRKTFNQPKLAELAESIKASGVHQPILVRPLPGSRVQDTFDNGITGGGMRRPTHEVVCGERRYRASQQAGLQTIPALVRDLTDAQVMEIQLVENLQRDDLTELEEAEGYQALMEASSLNADAIAVKIGKSRSYVFGRLKLLDLCTEARDALRTGAIDASRALLVARIPDSKLQIKAIKEIVEGHSSYYSGGREAMSHREAKAHIQERYMVKLDSAKFDITCIDLVPAAGSCKTCAKRTGHDPDLFADVKGADVCTDPPCFHAKEAAHAAVLVEQAKAKGQTVIAGRQALELMPYNGYNTKFKGYRRLDDATDSPTDKPLRKIIGKQMEADGIAPIMIEHPHKKGELVAVLTNDVVARLLKTVQGQADAAKSVSKEVKQLVEEKNAVAAAKEKLKFEQGWRDELLAATWDRISQTGAPMATQKLCRYLARRAAAGLNTDDASAICKLLDLGKVAPYQAVMDWIKDMPNPDHALALLTMHRDSDVNDYSCNKDHIANEGLMLVAGNAFGDDLPLVIEDIKDGLKAEVREAQSAKAKKSPLPLASAAQAKGAGGAKAKKAQSPAALASPVPMRKRKMTADEAQAAIATAMRGQDTNPGADAQGIDGAGEQPVATSAAVAPGVAQAVDRSGYTTAVNIVVTQRDTRPVHLMTMLGVSNSTAVGMLDEMEYDGIVGPLQKDGTRKVLLPSLIPVTDDPLFQAALDIITREQKANVRLLKTGLKVGTTRALELMDKLEQAGEVSACDERGARKVLVAV